MALDLTPEIVSPDIKKAGRAIKLSCLYFDRTIFQHRALYARPRAGAQVLAAGRVIEHPGYHTEDDVRVFLDSLQPLQDAGVLFGTPDYSDDVIIKHMEPYAAAVDSVREEMLRRGGVSDQLRDSMRFVDLEMIFTGGLLDLCQGFPTSPDSDLLRWFCAGYKHQLTDRWEAMPKEDKARVRRDELATQAIQQRLPNVADLPVEEILRLRDRQRDNLLRFRAEMGNLVETLEPDIEVKEFDAFVKRTIEEKIDPAVAELRAQLADLRRSSWVKAREYAGAAGLSLMGVSAFSGAAPAVLAGVGAVGAVAGALHILGEHQASKKSKLDHPFALFLQG